MKEKDDVRSLIMCIQISTSTTGRVCGDCMFLDFEGGPFCRLFGCETLYEYKATSNTEREFFRCNMCKHFDRTGEVVTDEDQRA